MPRPAVFEASHERARAYRIAYNGATAAEVLYLRQIEMRLPQFLFDRTKTLNPANDVGTGIDLVRVAPYQHKNGLQRIAMRRTPVVNNVHRVEVVRYRDARLYKRLADASYLTAAVLGCRPLGHIQLCPISGAQAAAPNGLHHPASTHRAPAS